MEKPLKTLHLFSFIAIYTSASQNVQGSSDTRFNTKRIVKVSVRPTDIVLPIVTDKYCNIVCLAVTIMCLSFSLN